MKESKTIPLRLKPRKNKKQYGIQIQQTDSKGLPLNMHFTLTVAIVVPNHQQGIIYEIKKHQTFINDKAVDLTIEELAEDISQCFYPLRVLVGKSGTIIGIANFGEIQSRWRLQKQKIAAYYKGSIATDLLKSADALFNHEEKFHRALYGFWEINLLFGPLYGDYIIPSETPVIRYFPLFGAKQMTETKIQLTNIEHTPAEKTIYSFSGSFIDQPEQSNSNYKTEGTIQIHYILENNYTSVFSVIAAFEWKDQEGKTQQKNISIFDTTVHRNSIIIYDDEEVKPVKKKSLTDTILDYLVG